MMTATVAIIAQAKRPISRHFCGDVGALVRSMRWPVRRASSSSMLRSEELSEDGRAKRGSLPAMVRDWHQRLPRQIMIAEQRNVFGVKESAPDRARIFGGSAKAIRLKLISSR